MSSDKWHAFAKTIRGANRAAARAVKRQEDDLTLADTIDATRK